MMDEVEVEGAKRVEFKCVRFFLLLAICLI